MLSTTVHLLPVAISDTSVGLIADYSNQSRSGTTSTMFESDNNVNFTHLEFYRGCRVVYKQLDYLPWNNPDSKVSLKTVVLTFKVIGAVFMPMLALIGMVANATNCLVFFKQGLRDRINMLLFSLACVDFIVECYVFIKSLELTYTLIVGRFTMTGPMSTHLTNNGIHTMYGFVYVSGFISTVISVERCFCITHPFTAKRILKTGTTAAIVAVCGTLFVGVHYMVADKYRIYCQYYPSLGFSVKGFFPSPFYLRYTQLVDVLNGTVYGFGLPSVFVLTTTVTTAVTAVKLKSAAAWRRDQSSGSKMEGKELALTRMLIAVSCLFIACTLPNIFFRVSQAVVPEFRLGGRYQNLLIILALLVYVAPAINSSLNFFFYFQMGSRFRKTLTDLCCCRVKGDTGDSLGTTVLSTVVTE